MQRYSAPDPSPIMTTALDGLLQPFNQVKTPLNHIIEEDKIHDFRENALDFEELDPVLSTMVNTIAHRFPSIDICEIGAGTGRPSERILAKIGAAYSSSTYTDINPRLFHEVQQRLVAHKKKVKYRTLDITRDPLQQGFGEGVYDVIVAANVFHVTPDLEATLRNARCLLQPGGYLLMIECVENGPIHPTFIMGCLSQWWAGQESGRQWRPNVSVAEWDELLFRTGFSGVDSATPVPDPLVMPAAVIVSQAVDQELKR